MRDYVEIYHMGSRLENPLNLPSAYFEKVLDNYVMRTYLTIETMAAVT